MRSRLIDEYPRSTVDFVPFANLLINGIPVLAATGLTYSVVPEFDQPTWPGAAVMTDTDTGELGFMLNGPALGRGVFRVFVKATGGDTTPVIEAGYFRLT